jgi:putative ABC transport system permease protein
MGTNIKLAWRSLLRDKVYSGINISGLGIAAAFVILVLVYVTHIMEHDTFSNQTENLFRVEMTQFRNVKQETNADKKSIFDGLLKESTTAKQLTTPLVLANDLKQHFPEIRDVTRIAIMWAPVVRVGNLHYKEEVNNVAEVDPNFFAIMGLPLWLGNSFRPFENSSNVVLSEKAAKKYFGNSNPIGQTLSLGEYPDKLFTVSAIAKDFPENSTFRFDVMTLHEGSDYYQAQMDGGINSMSHLTLVSLMPDIDLEKFEEKFSHFGQRYFKGVVEDLKSGNETTATQSFELSIRPFRETQFNVSTPWPYFTDLKSLLQLLLLAIITIAIACTNYVLLSLSRVAGRSQESGIRKTMGAGIWQITRMFLTETFLLMVISLVVGYLLAILALPFFCQLADVQIAAGALLNWKVLLGIVILCFILTIVSGIYPALRMAGVSPLSLMNRFGTNSINPTLSRLFVTFQYATCTILIALVIIIYQQMNFIYHKDLGFDKEQVILVENPFRSEESASMLLRQKVKQFVEQDPVFTDVTSTNFRFAHGHNLSGHTIDGKLEYVYTVNVDFNYFSFNKIPIVEGREFLSSMAIDTISQRFSPLLSEENSSGWVRNIVVNEKLYDLLGRPTLNTLNKPMGSIIVGVCSNYDYMGAQQEVRPLYHVCMPGRPGYFWFKVGSNHSLQAAVESIQAQWGTFTGNQPFSYTFMDEDVQHVYVSNRRWMQIINTSSRMAIFIACLGLFGLSAITAISKTKEVAIRKVLGAGMAQIYFSLNRDTLLLVLMAIVLSIPVANYLAESWLQNFAYRINIHWSVYLLAGMVALFCAILAISFHTVKASKTNPVNSLRKV